MSKYLAFDISPHHINALKAIKSLADDSSVAASRRLELLERLKKYLQWYIDDLPTRAKAVE